MISFDFILHFFINSLDEVLYAFISPEIPSFFPPKYLTTTIKIFVKSFILIWLRIGLPAVELGSPSSELFCIDESSDKT